MDRALVVSRPSPFNVMGTEILKDQQTALDGHPVEEFLHPEMDYETFVQS